MACYVFFVCFFLGIYRSGLSSSSAVTQTVVAGENITLHCNISPSTEMFWYRHINQELTMILSATKGNIGKELASYNKEPDHFQMLPQNVSFFSQNLKMYCSILFYFKILICSQSVKDCMLPIMPFSFLFLNFF